MNVETVLAGRLSPVSPNNASVLSSSVSSVQFRVRRDDRQPSRFTKPIRPMVDRWVGTNLGSFVWNRFRHQTAWVSSLVQGGRDTRQ